MYAYTKNFFFFNPFRGLPLSNPHVPSTILGVSIVAIAW